MCYYRQQTFTDTKWNEPNFLTTFNLYTSIWMTRLFSLSPFLSPIGWPYEISLYIHTHIHPFSIYPLWLTFFFFSPSSVVWKKRRKEKKSWVIIWMQWMNEWSKIKKWNVHKNRFNRIDYSIDIRPFRERTA